MRGEQLLRLYPRVWRERYGAEFLAMVGDTPPSLQQTIDIVSGAIDAWLSADVKNATAVSRVVSSGEGAAMERASTICHRKQVRYTNRDALIGAGVMIVGSLLLSLSGISVRKSGWPTTGEVLINLSFLGALTLSMPFWLMKGQPWKAQVVIVGGTLLLLTAIIYAASVV